MTLLHCVMESCGGLACGLVELGAEVEAARAHYDATRQQVQKELQAADVAVTELIRLFVAQLHTMQRARAC